MNKISHLEVQDNVKDALKDSTKGLFGIYKNKEGKEYICCNGGKFQPL